MSKLVHTTKRCAMVLVALVVLAVFAPLSSCQSLPPDPPAARVGFAQLSGYLLAAAADLNRFRHDGPFAYRETENLVLPLVGDHPLTCDAVLPDSGGKSPLVIFVHGNQSRKEAHRNQARRLATYGIAALLVQVPNRDQWFANGLRLARLAQALAQKPTLLPGAIDTSNAVLIGHSFGGSAVAIAAGRGAPVRGVILLDPAALEDNRLPGYLRQVHVPVMLLGADGTVFRSRHRSLFYNNISGATAELSIRGATHNDAQNPSLFALKGFGFDPYTSRRHQDDFTAALTAAVISVTATGGLDYAWKNYAAPLATGEFVRPRRRAALSPTEN